MWIELLTLGSGSVVILACASARLLSVRSSSEEPSEPGARPWIGVVTPEALERLPLVAPDRAGYGTASRLLIRAAADLRSVPAPTPISGHYEGGSQAA